MQTILKFNQHDYTFTVKKDGDNLELFIDGQLLCHGDIDKGMTTFYRGWTTREHSDTKTAAILMIYLLV